MKMQRICFFGHRVLEKPTETEEKLEQLLREIIRTSEFVEFCVGRSGDFDLMAAYSVRRVRKALDYGNTELILVLPFLTAAYRDAPQDYENYYDSVEICNASANAHFKSAYRIRNRDLIDRCDTVICCIEHQGGGAWQAVRYAIQQGKRVINLAEG